MKRASYTDPCVRGWVRNGPKIIRFLSCTNYGQCSYGGEPREFAMRLKPGDPRPRGIHFRGMEYPGALRKVLAGTARMLESLPVGVWVELDFAH